MKNYFNANTILIIAIGIFLLCNFYCGKQKDGSVIVSQTSDTAKKFDSAQTTLIKTDIWHHEVSSSSDTQWVIMQTDTVMLRKMFEQYMKVYFYSDTTRDTASQVQAIVQDTVTQNMIRWRKVWLKNLRPVTTITNTTVKEEPARNKVFLGVFGGIDSVGYIAGGQITLMNVNEDLMQINIEPLRKGFTIGLSKKISFRKQAHRIRDAPN
jgi:hypothetical protein